MSCPTSEAEVTAVLKENFVKQMVNGNDMYDAQLRSGLLSVDEVLAAWPDAGVVVEKEKFARDPGQWEAVVHMLCEAGHVCAGLLVQTPISVALCGAQDTIALFDSHSHGENGAAVTVVCKELAAAYLQQSFPRGFAHFHRLKLSHT